MPFMHEPPAQPMINARPQESDVPLLHQRFEVVPEEVRPPSKPVIPAEEAPAPPDLFDDSPRPEPMSKVSAGSSSRLVIVSPKPNAESPRPQSSR
ncbi:MAG: hypothetical protein IT427_19220 [Pirellulales bacterium]|nr:hypothetical protein [Pirellulales bacterium]